MLQKERVHFVKHGPGSFVAHADFGQTAILAYQNQVALAAFLAVIGTSLKPSAGIISLPIQDIGMAAVPTQDIGVMTDSLANLSGAIAVFFLQAVVWLKKMPAVDAAPFSSSGRHIDHPL
jgi:hypothetical protein